VPFITGGSSGGSSGATTKISSATLGAPAANLDITSIPGTFTSLELHALVRSDQGASSNTALTFNGDSAAHYDRQTSGANATSGIAAAGTAESGILSILYAITGTTASVFTTLRVVIPFYSGTTAFKNCFISSTEFQTLGTGATYEVDNSGFLWRSTAAITRITIAPAAGNWIAGSAYALYGLA
jgi:hypothetical protein